MITAMITIFVIGYLLFVLEHILKFNKSRFVLVMFATIWFVISLLCHDYSV